jgi:hypothetical protein
MCGKLRIGKALMAARTLRARAEHCRISEKTLKKQATDRAAHCGLLSGPLNRGLLPRLGHLRLLFSTVSELALFCDTARPLLNHLVDPVPARES